MGPPDRLGIGKPNLAQVFRQLKFRTASAPEVDAAARPCFAKRGNRRASLAGHVDPERASFCIDTVLFGLADIVIEAITSRSEEDHKIFRQAGFDLFWKGAAADLFLRP